jgi:hypothetical protein
VRNYLLLHAVLALLSITNAATGTIATTGDAGLGETGIAIAAHYLISENL